MLFIEILLFVVFVSLVSKVLIYSGFVMFYSFCRRALKDDKKGMKLTISFRRQINKQKWMSVNFNPIDIVLHFVMFVPSVLFVLSLTLIIISSEFPPSEELKDMLMSVLLESENKPYIPRK
jgi:Ni,Fe-hydrogenase I cytochrome b subunit